MRGTIVAIAPDGTYGQLAADDGQRYSYWSSEVRNGRAQAGQMVDFQMADDQPIEIFIVAPPSAPPASRSMPPQRMPQQNVPQYRAQQQGMPQQGTQRQFVPQQGIQQFAGEQPVSSANYWVKLFTSPSGRISRRQFWLHGVLPILGASIVLGWIPVIGQILSLAFLWGGICIAFKRFHDLGYPGWWSLAYLAPFIAGTVLFGVSMFSILTAGGEMLWLAAEILWGIGALIGLAQLIFVYIRPGQPGPNQYGPDPLASM